MNFSDSSFTYQSTSPLASTEEKSLQDNIDVNKLNLEKGLRNRPNQYVLVERGILLNPGKAHSDMMHQLDLAKKRDTLKKKIENRPDRDELVRKLILPDGIDSRKNEIDRIKQLLDCSINTRPGSLELVDKNILQVDRLLASKVHNGDITYPKVCLEDITFNSNSCVLLPPISEVDLQASLNDLSDILSQSSAKSTNKPTQISYKKTCRVGRYSFHNIEFRPTAQKAREYQQNELLEYEKIQAQHDPSLKKVHSELTMKSRHKIDCVRSDKYRSTKYSLLNRLNVHELKSECKQRLITCSNIPKAQLIEKLLPFETEILRCHSSVDPNRNCQTNRSDRRTYSLIQSGCDLSPPDFTTQTNLTPPPYQSLSEPFQCIEPLCNDGTLLKISHSISEPIILDCNNQSNNISSFQYNFPNNSATNFHYTTPSYDGFNPNNSYPLLTDDVRRCHPLSNSLLPMEYPQPPIKPDNVVCHSESPAFWNSNNFNGFVSKTESSLMPHPQYSTSVSEHFFSPIFSIENPSTSLNATQSSVPDQWCNQIATSVPFDVNVPRIPSDCIEKFELISKQTDLFKEVVDRINQLKKHNPNHAAMNSFLDEYESIRARLMTLINDMINFIRMEVKLRRLDQLNANLQINWLLYLLDLINNGFSAIKYERCSFNGTDLLSSNGLSLSNDNDTMSPHNDTLDDLDMNDFLNLESIKEPTQSTNNNNHIFLKKEKLNLSLDNYDNFNGNNNDLKTPETPFSDICNSPMSTDDLDQIMNCFLHPSNDHFM